MKKTLAFLLVLVMALSCVTSFAAMVDTTDTDFYTALEGLKTDDSDHEEEAKAHENDCFNAAQAGYVKEGDSVYWTLYTGAMISGEYLPFGSDAVEISDSFTGEYVITNKMRIGYTSASGSSVDNGMYFLFNSTSANYYFGYDLRALSTGTVEVSFTYNPQKSKGAHSYSIGSYQVGMNDWCTYQQVYNLDKRTAELHIYNASGTEIATFTHNLLPVVEGVEVPYQDFYFQKYYVSNSGGTNPKRARIAIDDCEIVKTAKMPVTANFDSTMVSVTYGGQAVTSGVATPVTYGEDAVFTVTPKDDYEITGITVDGEAIDSKTEVSFEDIKEAHTFSVTAKYDDYFDRLYNENYKVYEDSAVLEGEATHQAVGYINDQGNIFKYVWAKNGIDYDLPFGYVTISDGLTGEYVLSTKMRYHNWPYTTSLASVHFSAGFDITDKNKCFFGYKVAWDAAGTATVSFNYRYKDVVDTGFTAGTFAYTDNAWYTYQQVYNLDDMKVYLHVYNSEGAEVAKFTHELKTEINGTTIPYKHLATSSIRTEAKTKAQVFIDDVAIYKSIAKPVVVNYDSAKGSVTYNGNPVVSGEKIPVPYNSAEAQVFSIAANEGYEISDVTVNDVSNSVIDSYDFKGIKADQTMTVTFKAEAPAQPEVTFGSYTPAANYAYTKGGVQKVAPYSVIMYGNVTGTPFEYGFKLGGGSLTETYKMPYVGTPTQDGMFAIRVVGDVLEADTYIATPYVVVSNGDADTDGTATDITIQ